VRRNGECACVWLDLVALDEDRAHAALLDGVNQRRAKPSRAPAYPGAQQTPRVPRRYE
jgi:hypothetical protein